MQARDLRVPVQAQLVARRPADADARGVVGEVQDPLGAVTVAEHEEGPAPALGLDPIAQLGGRGAMGLEW